MSPSLKHILTILMLISSFLSLEAQSEQEKLEKTKNWFAEFNLGVQMSGIKSEDFVSSNYSPVYKLSFGKWITKGIAVRIGYQGRYFRSIADELRYTYNFYSVEGVLDIRDFFSKEEKERKYTFFLHGGLGLFHHKIYDRNNIHVNMGISNVFTLSEEVKLTFDISAIVGWDIYQGDQDILPNSSIGIMYVF